MIEKKINFTSTISDGDEQLDHAFTSTGTIFLTEKGTLNRLDFNEPIEDGLIVETSIIVTNNSLRIMREGLISMAQTFVMAEEVAGTYETDHGVLDVSVYTRVLEITGNGEFGEIYLVYDLYIEHQYTSNVSLNIEYE